MGFSPEQMKKYSRYVVEEVIRRGIKSGTLPISKAQILKILVPNWKKIVDTFKSAFSAQIQADKVAAAANSNEFAGYM